MIINIDTDYIMSLFDCDFDTAATTLADLDDQRDTVLDMFNNAIIDYFRNNEWIRLAWCSEDVMQHCDWLTKDQALEVLHDLERNHDACIGINWDVIRDTVAVKYPKPEEADDGEV